MTARLRLPRILAQTANTELTYLVEGSNVEQVLASLFEQRPGLRNHIIDETGVIRPHVSLFVDGIQADLAGEVGEQADIRILHAVSGG